MYSKNYFEKLVSIKDENDFEKMALDVFRYQSANNPVYAEYVKGLNIDRDKVSNILQIPFLPVELFKTNKILTGDNNFERIFTSSGTTGSEESKHYIKNISLYEKVFSETFSSFYGDTSEYTILALLPSYLERKDSSLIYMMERLIDMTNSSESGFYLYEYEKLFSMLNNLQKKRKKTLLFGVSYALLDFSEQYKINFPELIVMETGGMKGKRKELIREEFHELLCKAFGVKTIHSEYGMTELVSQAYSFGNGIFKSPKWMRILVREPDDPLVTGIKNSSGGINIIDLANIDSCAVLATQDLGKVYDDNSFEVIGRFDFSDVRGCNLMVE
jgi:phenylacetate-coenzyme A ligase PaaK-like adenylate-forming protein